MNKYLSSPRDNQCIFFTLYSLLFIIIIIFSITIMRKQLSYFLPTCSIPSSLPSFVGVQNLCLRREDVVPWTLRFATMRTRTCGRRWRRCHAPPTVSRPSSTKTPSTSWAASVNTGTASTPSTNIIRTPILMRRCRRWPKARSAEICQWDRGRISWAIEGVQIGISTACHTLPLYVLWAANPRPA
jgi:hypothetical protein